MKSIFKGKMQKEIYYFDVNWSKHNINLIRNYYPPKEIYIELETIEASTFLELDINEPSLNQGERFYNHKDNEIYHIEYAMRGTDDTMVYFTDKVLKTIIDEESKIKAEKELNEYKAIQKADREEAEALRKEKELAELSENNLIVPKKSWWKRLLKK